MVYSLFITEITLTNTEYYFLLKLRSQVHTPHRGSCPPTPDGKSPTSVIHSGSGSTGDASAASLSGSALGGLPTKEVGSLDAVVQMVKDVDGMINRLPAARGSKGPTDGELSALEEEVFLPRAQRFV